MLGAFRSNQRLREEFLDLQKLAASARVVVRPWRARALGVPGSVASFARWSMIFSASSSAASSPALSRG